MSTNLLQKEEAAIVQKALAHQLSQSGLTHEQLGAQTGLSTAQVEDALNVTKAAQEAGHVHQVHSTLKKTLKTTKTAAQVVTVTKEVKELNKLSHKLVGSPSNPRTGGKRPAVGDLAAVAAGGAAISGLTKAPRKKKKAAKVALPTKFPTSVSGLATEVAENKAKSAAKKSVKKGAQKAAVSQLEAAAEQALGGKA